jgi:hypothetical protein
MEVEEYAGTPLAADGSDLPSGTVPLSRLVTGDSPRLCGENSSHARMLASLRDALPPISVHRPTMRVIDGMHRLRAARLRGADKIKVRPTVTARRRRLSANNLQSDTRIGMDGQIRPVDPALRADPAFRPTGTGLGRPGGGAPRSRAAGPAARRPWTPRRQLQALTPGSAISEGAVRGRLRMFVFGSRVDKDSAAYRTRTRGHRRRVRVYRARRNVIRHPSRSERAGEIEMVSRASATLNLVTPTLLACLAALRLGHAVAFLPASIDHEMLEPPDSGTESWLPPRSASCLADQ